MRASAKHAVICGRQAVAVHSVSKDVAKISGYLRAAPLKSAAEFGETTPSLRIHRNIPLLLSKHVGLPRRKRLDDENKITVSEREQGGFRNVDKRGNGEDGFVERWRELSYSIRSLGFLRRVQGRHFYSWA